MLFALTLKGQDIRFAGLWVGYSQQIHFKKLDWTSNLSNLFNVEDKKFQNLDFPASDIRFQFVNILSFRPKSSQVSLGAGLHYQRNYPLDSRFTEEIRPFEQIEYKKNIESFSMVHMLRLNERFVENKETGHYSFALGAQYRTTVRYEITKTSDKFPKYYLSGFSEEYFLFFGSIKYQFFSEYWAYLGFGAEINKKNKLEIGLGHEYLIRNVNLQIRSIWYPAINWITRFDCSGKANLKPLN